MKKGYTAYLLGGGLWRLLVVVILAVLIYRNEKAIDAALPRVEGKPGALRETLGFPWKGFPEISETERKELDNLIPLDPAIRVSDLRPWTQVPSSGWLGGADVARNAPLLEAFAILDQIRSQRQNNDGTANEAELLADAKKKLTAAQAAATPATAWIVHYNAGVVYAWERNSQRAAREFERAAWRLSPLTQRAGVTEEVRSAAIHALYGWGDSLIEASSGGAVPKNALDALRGAVIQATNLSRARNPRGVGYAAAEFYELAPTGLSTSALRNDLLSAYLHAPQYSYCGSKPMPADICETGAFSGGCRYRDERFCKTKGRQPLQGMFESQVKAFQNGAGNEAMVWALQNAVEIDADNLLHDQPVVAYNIAKLLHDLKRPDLAYRTIHPVTTGSHAAEVTAPILRLGWVSSILANEKVDAMPAPKGSGEPSAYRLAYTKLYPKEAPSFQPLQLEDAQKAKSLDAWLFIRRYRDLLARGELETFIVEHQRFKALGEAPTDFLDTWKRDVVVAFLRRAQQVREKAQPATKETIDTFLSRSELFTSEELELAGIDRPFAARKLRWLLYALALALTGWLTYDFWWKLRAYRSTFESAYQRDRRSRTGA